MDALQFTGIFAEWGMCGQLSGAPCRTQVLVIGDFTTTCTCTTCTIMQYLCIVHVYMYSYALCGYTCHLRTCQYSSTGPVASLKQGVKLWMHLQKFQKCALVLTVEIKHLLFVTVYLINVPVSPFTLYFPQAFSCFVFVCGIFWSFSQVGVWTLCKFFHVLDPGRCTYVYTETRCRCCTYIYYC